VTGPRAYHRVPVAKVVTETDDACSLVLDVPPELADVFAYRPGQFLTVRVPDGNNGSVARCYSLSSSPHTSDPPTITVKRIADGYASNWIADNVQAGGVLDLLPPAGTFSPDSLTGDFLLFAAGSGITPVISIVKSALAAGRGRIVLVYANRDERSVIFGPELHRLAAAAAGRLLVVHWLDSLQGTPTPSAMAELARPYAGGEAFACGPDPYLAVVRQALAQLGVPAKGIHVERFLSLEENPFEATEATGGTAATLEVCLDGATRRLEWPAGTRMLDVLIDQGLAAPFSCRQGVCGACACQLTAGQVEMAHNEVLEAEDIAEGYILACQAVALTPDVSITY
jgi:3-ketosteroid 9alpha-monooxygenase subunit B